MNSMTQADIIVLVLVALSGWDTPQVYKYQIPGHWMTLQDITNEKDGNHWLHYKTLQCIMSWWKHSESCAGFHEKEGNKVATAYQAKVVKPQVKDAELCCRLPNPHDFTGCERPSPSVLGNLCVEQNCSFMMSAHISMSPSYIGKQCWFWVSWVTREAKQYSKHKKALVRAKLSWIWQNYVLLANKSQ